MGFQQAQNEHTHYIPIKFLTWKILGLYKSQLLKPSLLTHTHKQQQQKQNKAKTPSIIEQQQKNKAILFYTYVMT